MRASLEPGGYFVISELPFPHSTEGLQTLPGRMMTGDQFWEAQIDDQLLPGTSMTIFRGDTASATSAPSRSIPFPP